MKKDLFDENESNNKVIDNLIPNNIDFSLYNQFVKVTLKNNCEISGVFNEIHEMDNEIVVNGVTINYDEIKEIISYYSPIERHLMLTLSKEDIEFMRKIGINTLTSYISEIYEEIHNYLQTYYLNENIINHCENILNKLSKSDLINEKLYTYVSVIYEDDIVAKTTGKPSFYYKTTIKEISVGDKVLVNRNDKETVGLIVEVKHKEKNKVPYPLNKTKDIIKILNNYGDKIEVYQSNGNKYVEMIFLGKYKYIGGEYSIDLTIGNIYNRVGSEKEFRIVDDSGEDYLYSPKSFIKL